MLKRAATNALKIRVSGVRFPLCAFSRKATSRHRLDLGSVALQIRPPFVTPPPSCEAFHGRQAAPLVSHPIQPIVAHVASRPPSLFDASIVITPDRIANRRGGAPPRTGHHRLLRHESEARAGAPGTGALRHHSGAPAPRGQAWRIPARSRDADHALRSGKRGAPHVVGAPGRSPPGCLRTPAASLSRTGSRPRFPRYHDPSGHQTSDPREPERYRLA